MQHFIPTHEPGSLLSYRPLEGSTYDTPGNTFYEGQVINLSTSSSQNWGIEFTTLSFEEVENARDHSLAYSASIGAFGISASIEGSYDWSEIATQTTEVGSGIQIATNLGTIPLASSNALYNTKPFIFWDQNNTMVLDYEVSATGDFYTQNYNIQDPAWNMPWRLDPERGDLSVTPTLTRQTKSLWFDDHSPEPGDTITVFARVFNYSLVATESPVDVSFFLGNPYNGGQAIAGINGETSVSTDGIIAPQQFKEVSMHLILPADVDYDGRLYARIDPDSIMIEVHEENNLTWKSLGPNFNLIEDDYEEEAPIMINEGEINWHLQCYPNPTKNNVDIWAQLDHPQITQVYVYNVFGDIVHEEAAIANGLGQCHVQLQLNSLPAGMYVVQLTNAHAQQSLRLIKE
jgi:hypothetical protein